METEAKLNVRARSTRQQGNRHGVPRRRALGLLSTAAQHGCVARKSMNMRRVGRGGNSQN